MCNLYSITTNQAAIAAMFRIVNRYAGNLLPLLGVFPDYQAPIVLNGADGTRTRGGAMGHAVGRPRAQYLLIYSPGRIVCAVAASLKQDRMAYRPAR